MFKIGDKIRCVRALKGHKLTVGDFYTIYCVSISFSETYVYVEEHCGYMFDENRFVLAEESETNEFQAGDIVEFGGLEGVVSLNENDDEIYPINVRYDGGYSDRFTMDGRFNLQHTKPLLNFISRKEEKIELSADEIENAIHTYVSTKAVLTALGFGGE